jgi:8-oxo-dGTP pyrophosphatase MutT (NUDIX family)
MAAFDKDQAHFNYRVAGVAIHNGRILLDRNSRNTYWVLPGGHPEMMEPMAEALRREVKEEIGADVEVVRLLWIMENFFHKSKDIHELSFYFLMQITPDSDLLKSDGPFYGQEHEHRLTFQWFPLDEAMLAGLPLNPGYLSRALLNIPDTIQHVVFNDVSHYKGSPKSNELAKSSAQRLTIP